VRILSRVQRIATGSRCYIRRSRSYTRRNIRISDNRSGGRRKGTPRLFYEFPASYRHVKGIKGSKFGQYYNFRDTSDVITEHTDHEGLRSPQKPRLSIIGAAAVLIYGYIATILFNSRGRTGRKVGDNRGDGRGARRRSSSVVSLLGRWRSLRHGQVGALNCACGIGRGWREYHQVVEKENKNKKKI
jgi:hypothetical protein